MLVGGGEGANASRVGVRRNVLELDTGDGPQLCGYSKMHSSIRFRSMNLMVNRVLEKNCVLEKLL